MSFPPAQADNMQHAKQLSDMGMAVGRGKRAGNFGITYVTAAPQESAVIGLCASTRR
jgi:hypothetical protein